MNYALTMSFSVTMLCEVQPLLVSAAVKGISLIGKTTEIPDFEVEIKQHLEEDEEDAVIEKSKFDLNKIKYIH